MRGEGFDLRDTIGEQAGLPAAGRSFDQVKHSRPAHEAVERRVGLVKNGPQVVVRVLVPSIADGRSAAGEMSGREEWSTFHGLQRPFWFGKEGFAVRPGSPPPRRHTTTPPPRNPQPN